MSLKNDRNGFTLLEVMISLAMVSVLIITVLYTLKHHLTIAQRHETATVAVMLAVEKLSELRQYPVLREQKGSFAVPYADYRYTVKVGKSSFAGISEITVIVSRDNEEVSLRKLVLDKTPRGKYGYAAPN